MKDGFIQHIGTPKDIYQRPANLFVASFIGRTNLLDAQLSAEDGQSFLVFANGYKVAMNHVKDEFKKTMKVKVSIRPEEFVILENSTTGIKAVIEDSIFLGLNTHYQVKFENGVHAEIVQESRIDSITPPGTEIYLTVKSEKINVFTEDGQRNCLSGVRNDYEQYVGK
jgi:iron(III) transport system ATP-binding protein